MASCNDDDEKFFEEYYANLQELKETGHIPLNIKKKVPYKVYSLQGISCGSHRFIVLSSDDKRFFSIELEIIE